MQMSRVDIAGYLAAKPQLRYLPSGTPVANARLAQTYKYKDSNQQPIESTNWHCLSFYGDLAQLATSTYDKGDNLWIEGVIEQREFSPKDGSKRTINEIVVRRAHLIARTQRTATTPSENEPIPEFKGGSENDWPVR